MNSPLQALDRQRKLVRLRARRSMRTGAVVAAAVGAGAAAVGFAKLCDAAMEAHARLLSGRSWLGPLLLVVGLPLCVALTRRLAPAAAGSGIPQVIAAGEIGRGRDSGGEKIHDERVSIRTAMIKVALAALLLLCGGSIGREGPTVQVVAAVMVFLTGWLRGGPGRRTLLIAGGAAGVSAAFNTPIAGIVFAVEELARGFDKRANTVVILSVVSAGVAAYALGGNYAYFGDMSGSAGWNAWVSAALIGVGSGLMGGLFSRLMAAVLVGDNPVRRWKDGRPIIFATVCGGVAAAAALLSGGGAYGAGYAEAKSLLFGKFASGWGLAVGKWIATLAAAVSGAPGGIFAPSLATGAGLGALFSHMAPWAGSREAVTLGMAGYLAGVVQAPLTSAVILMEMTRDPGLVGPLLLCTLVARRCSEAIAPVPLYHALARAWTRPRRRSGMAASGGGPHP
ncbi:chloride channel protein [Caulobacter sp. CCH9-E1]|uniref:chloride channel protein n=1 Tax=Caulobacter sp. CCH9-E1 TaxID=1768768 RepID=UPI001E61CF56|nr:chloride channel protein [Caulobacter sp. CCH9-E1]